MVKALVLSAALTGAAMLVLLAAPAWSGAKTAGELQSSIANKRAKAAALSSDVQSMSSKIQGLRGRIAQLQSKQNSIEVDLDRKVSREQRIAGDLDKSRSRLAWLKRKLSHSRSVLKKRVVAVYKQGEPSFITIVLESDGFAEMVERTTYLREIARQDNAIIAE